MINLKVKHNRNILIGILIIIILVLFVLREPPMDIYECKNWAYENNCHPSYCITLLAPITESECEFLLQEKLSENGLDTVCKDEGILSGKSVSSECVDSSTLVYNPFQRIGQWAYQ